MIDKFLVDETTAEPEFGMACQRLIPWAGQGEEPPAGLMACFLEPGAKSDPDLHSQDEVMLVLSGTGRVDLAGESTDIGPRELVVLPGNHEHVVHNSGDTQLVWVSLYWPLHEASEEVA